MKFMKLKEGQKGMQLIKLKAIEKLPDKLPDSKAVREYTADQTESVSIRKPMVDSHTRKTIRVEEDNHTRNKSNLTAKSKKTERQERKLACRMSQVASMLRDMNVIKPGQDLDDVKDGES